MPSLSRFLRLIQEPVTTNVFNPWLDHDPTTDTDKHAPAERRARLRAHLSCRPKYLLIGEAPGYQGCKVSGIPFTSERLILEGAIPRVAVTFKRLSSRNRPWSEPSATIVWGILHDLGKAEQTILWNAYPWHPHRPGVPHSNRTPTREERQLGAHVLAALIRIFPTVRLFALGKQAQSSLKELGYESTALRHPAMGGAQRFRDQLRASHCL